MDRPEITKEYWLKVVRHMDKGKLSEQEMLEKAEEMYQFHLSGPSIEEVRARLGKKS